MILLIFFGGAVLWYVGKNYSAPAKLTENTAKEIRSAEADPELMALVSLDSDSDNLKDWEEALWKTNPQKKDTDGDGTSDGDEILAGRNPLKKGPNDLLPRNTSGQITPEDLTKAEAEVEKLTTTDRFARETFTAYLAMKNSPNASSANLDSAMTDTLASVAKEGLPIRYGSKDVIISSDNSIAALKSYANSLGQIIAAHDDIFYYNELEMLDNAVRANDPKLFKLLEKPYYSYLEMAMNVKKLSVPSDLTRYHLLVLNSLNGMASAVNNMKNFQQDPILGMLSTERFTTNYDNLSNGATALLNYLDNKHIVFDATDSGNELINL